MQTNPQPYRYTGLLAIVGLVALLAGLIIMLLLAEIRLAAWGIMGTGIILLASAFVLDFRRVSRALTGRRGRFGVGTTVMASIFIGITILLNGISINYYQRIDTTALGQFTLTEQTKDVLRAVTKPIKALCFFVSGKDTYGITTYAAGLLMEYQNYTDKLTVEYIDPDEHPERARQYSITQYQTVVFENESGQYRLVPPTAIIQTSTDQEGNLQIVGIEAEHSFTSAILEVTGVAQKKVYFLTGHGEADINGNYSYACSGLRDDLYLIGTLNLITNPTIPSDCAVLIIAAPQTALTAGEVEIINRYLRASGQVMILTDPNFPDGIDQVISPWGVSFENGTVIDPTSNLAPEKDIPSVPAERDAFGLPTTYFPGAVGIIPQEKPPADVRIQPLVQTSEESWLEKDYDPPKEAVFTDGEDVKGPLYLGVMIAALARDVATGQSAAQSKLTGLVVIGDSDFASNQNFAEVNNADLFLNSVNWLAEETELITIHRTVTSFRRLAVNPGEANFINYSSLALPPILVLIIGGIIWWRRR
jgi:ABC-type uncharacterized transport system involved in gliding motility auxiliary subunit